jgi:hypothetical protein
MTRAFWRFHLIGPTVLVWAMGLASASLAQEPQPRDFLHPIITMMCDATNKSWGIRNNHTYRSIQIEVRWHPEGGQAKSEMFVLPPGQERPIGCAPTLDIVSAKFMDF